jgi:hypothetical protein
MESSPEVLTPDGVCKVTESQGIVDTQDVTYKYQIDPDLKTRLIRECSKY